MIFRRRTTDQVYATLQQVQRRITEQGGPSAAPAPRSPGSGTNTFRATPMRTPPAGIAVPTRRETPVPADHTPLPIPAPAVTPAADRGVLEVPTQLAVTLMLVWLATLALVFALGRWSAPAPATVEAASTVRPSAPRDPEPPAPGKRLGDSIFVLKSLPRFNDVTKAAWQKEAERFNAICRDPQYQARGFKDYFAIREPENGGLEFVFGYANGAFGVDRTALRDFAAYLQRPTDKGGAGYVSAVWKSVE